MKLAVLEVSPSGPDKYHPELYDFPTYFVTHDNEHPDAISFNRGQNWAYNRNWLANYAVENLNYDYYILIDYDVRLLNDALEKIIIDLDKMKPAVLTGSYIRSGTFSKGIKYESTAFSNNMIKIMHKSALTKCFPLPMWFDGLWDCASHFNIVEWYAFQGSIIKSPYWGFANGESCNNEHNVDGGRGLRAMNKHYDWIKQFITHPLPTVTDLKNYAIQEAKWLPCIKRTETCDYRSEFKLKTMRDEIKKRLDEGE